MKSFVAVLIGVLAAGALIAYDGGLAFERAPARAAPLVDPIVGVPDTREAWARDLLSRLGNAQPTAPTVAFVVAWTVAEDGCMRDCGYASAWERFNPLNTTQTGFGATASINAHGVKAYPDYEQGMLATMQTLRYSYYTEIVAGLQTNDPERALRGLYASPWGTSAAHVERLWRNNER